MANKPEDLNLPTAVVTRIIKDALPDNCNVAKEAKLALAKAASVFVLYLTSYANGKAISHGRKTITNKDVMEAIEEIEFGKFEDALRDASEEYSKTLKNKKDATAKKKQTKDVTEDGEILEIE